MAIGVNVIGADSEVVEVKELLQVDDTAARHLENGKTDDFIVGRGEPLAIIILEVRFFYLQVELGLEGAEMGNLLNDISIAVELPLFGSVVPRPTE